MHTNRISENRYSCLISLLLKSEENVKAIETQTFLESAAYEPNWWQHQSLVLLKSPSGSRRMWAMPMNVILVSCLGHAPCLLSFLTEVTCSILKCCSVLMTLLSQKILEAEPWARMVPCMYGHRCLYSLRGSFCAITSFESCRACSLWSLFLIHSWKFHPWHPRVLYPKSVGVEPLTLDCSFSSLCQFFFFFWPCIKEDDFELLMLLSPTLECWDSWITWATTSSFTQCWGLMTASCMLGKQSINFATSSDLFLFVYVLFKHYIVRNTNWHSETHGCALSVNTTNGTLHCYSKVPGWSTLNSNSLGGYPWLLPGFISKLWTSYSFELTQFETGVDAM